MRCHTWMSCEQTPNAFASEQDPAYRLRRTSLEGPVARRPTVRSDFIDGSANDAGDASERQRVNHAIVRRTALGTLQRSIAMDVRRETEVVYCNREVPFCPRPRGSLLVERARHAYESTIRDYDRTRRLCASMRSRRTPSGCLFRLVWQLALLTVLGLLVAAGIIALCGRSLIVFASWLWRRS